MGSFERGDSPLSEDTAQLPLGPPTPGLLTKFVVFTVTGRERKRKINKVIEESVLPWPPTYRLPTKDLKTVRHVCPLSARGHATKDLKNYMSDLRPSAGRLCLCLVYWGQ